MELVPLEFRRATTLWRACLLACGLIGLAGHAAQAALPPPELWSPRPITTCQTAAGVPAPCHDGTLAGLDVSVDGQRALFVSADSHFVANDTNGQLDVLVSQGSHPCCWRAAARPASPVTTTVTWPRFRATGAMSSFAAKPEI